MPSSRFDCIEQVIEAGYTGKDGELFEVATVVFNTEIDDETCETRCTDAEFWVDEDKTHFCPFDALFTDLDEARDWCENFDGIVGWAKANGNGPDFDHIGVDVVRILWDDELGEWVPDRAISCYDWLWGIFPEVWHDEDIAEDR